MFAYHFSLALKSFRRNIGLTALMVLAIALGIGASMTTLTVFHVLSGDPLPDKSDTLFYTVLDPQEMEGYVAGIEPPDQMTRLDAEALVHAERADHQAIMAGGRLTVQPLGQGLLPFSVDARYTSPDFFPMFNTPFLFGGPWSAASENSREQVVVLGKTLNDTLFKGQNSVGKTVRLSGRDFVVSGVLAYWRPAPKFYDLYVGKKGFGESEQVFIPFSTAAELGLEPGGLVNCFGMKPQGMSDYAVGAPCVWVQLWVELDTPKKVKDYGDFLDNYSNQQRNEGRFSRPNNWRMRSLTEYLDYNKLVPSDVRLQMWLAFAFLGICLLNTVGLLLVKFLRRATEIGTRRALGASGRQIFTQHLVESATIGLLGGALGLSFALFGLWAVRTQPFDYAPLVRLDFTMLVINFLLAVLSSLLAGLLPAWRACLIAPAIQLKSD